ncbi:hypothetical protein [Pengzhenrongella frigida]|uniref:PPE domain-containing protein n=1 Tax=Pengzhenrongella frigida TaxID=1259133 RepID=A0A4Q5MZH7_9MICO|nr:hypothetical protein [Cellulomonas sp. HLT2-17]RYV51130.1 hypothetical protein EUA98_10150 [Cellulomonas sp. HLT2-17]
MTSGLAGASGWWSGAAARELGSAGESIAAALRGLAAADDVAWVSTAATHYRAALTESSATLQAARNLLDEAMVAVAAHDVAVEQHRRARQSYLAGARSDVLGQSDVVGRNDLAGPQTGGGQPTGWAEIARSLDLRAGPGPW